VRFILRKYGVQRVIDAWFTKGKWDWDKLCFVMPELKEAIDAWNNEPRYRRYPIGDAAFPTKRRADLPPVRGVTIPPIPPHRSMRAFPLLNIYEKMVHDKEANLPSNVRIERIQQGKNVMTSDPNKPWVTLAASPIREGLGRGWAAETHFSMGDVSIPPFNPHPHNQTHRETQEEEEFEIRELPIVEGREGDDEEDREILAQQHHCFRHQTSR
jgi:hypothetical protein